MDKVMDKMGIFDYIETAEGTYDYTATEISDQFAGLVKSGVVKGVGDQFDASAEGLEITIGTGEAWLLGHHGEMIGSTPLTVDPVSEGMQKICSVALDVDVANQQMGISIVVGTQAESPSAPQLIQTETHYQQEIWQGTVHDDGTITLSEKRVFMLRMGDLPAPEDIGAAAEIHASDHAAGGKDPVSPASIGAAKKSTITNATLHAANWGAECRNLFDEVWEQGVIATASGVLAASNYAIRSVNNIPVTGGTAYNFTHQSTLGNIYLIWYGASGYISYINITTISATIAPSEATYCKITMTNQTTAFSPKDARPFMFAQGSTVLPWEPQGRGYHIKASDYSQLAAITALTDITVRNPSARLITLAQYDAASEAKVLYNYQVAATEVVIVAFGEVPDIDIPIEIKIEGDVY